MVGPKTNIDQYNQQRLGCWRQGSIRAHKRVRYALACQTSVIAQLGKFIIDGKRELDNSWESASGHRLKRNFGRSLTSMSSMSTQNFSSHPHLFSFYCHNSVFQECSGSPRFLMLRTYSFFISHVLRKSDGRGQHYFSTTTHPPEFLETSVASFSKYGLSIINFS